jgi:predicted ATP-grasp superfamily ATP-dependent carboligase
VFLPTALERNRMKFKKKKVLILDPPDRRVIPTLGSIGNKYDFHFLIPIRKGFGFQKLIEATLRLCKPRNTRSIHFLSFITEEEFKQGLLDFLKRNHMDAVLPFSERSTAIILSIKSIIRDYTVVPFGSLEDFQILNDKYQVLKIANEQSIPTPHFKLIENNQTLKEIEQLGFPVVLKCCKASGVKEALRVCRDYVEVRQAYNDLSGREETYSFFPCSQLVAQEFIEGKIYDGCFAVKDGRVIAGMSQVREWTIPPSGGFGAYNITKKIPEIIEYGRRLFGRILWTGPAQLEFILDKKTKQYKLIEVNPRFWGTLALSTKAGINFPEFVLEAGFNGKLPPLPVVEDGIDFSWLLQETLYAEFLQGKGKRIIIKHLQRLLSSEVNNFSYSIIANLIISLPFLLSTLLVGLNPLSENADKSLVNRLFL